MTLLSVALQSGDAAPGAVDASRFMETVLDKIQSFGGQVDELSARRAVAAFGLEPEEDAPQHAAHVALALLKAGARARAAIRRGPCRASPSTPTWSWWAGSEIASSSTRIPGGRRTPCSTR